MQPGYPGQDPYGQQPSDPNAQPQQPTSGQPYGQPTSGQPAYGQPTSGQPYGQPTSGQPQYGQPPYQDAQQPYGQPAYGQPQYQDAQQPYQDPYGQPMPGQPYGAAPGYPAGAYPGAGQNNTFGLISMIVGIISIPGVCCWILGIPAGIAAIILGVIGRQKASRGEASNEGQALAGLICGAIGLLLSVGGLVVGIVANTSSFFYNP